MSEMDELQRRITAALDRIGQGLDGLTAGEGEDERAALRQELEDERLASAQLEERLKTLRQKLEEERAAARTAETERAGLLHRLDADLQSLRKANQQLRDNNRALREASEQGVSEPHLINKAMLTELEALRATRAAERAEVDAVMADLARAIDGAADEDHPQKENA